ncbi:MAG: hypothetical protein ACOYMG_01605 [Candidatus Methylumidiphilus sp.]
MKFWSVSTLTPSSVTLGLPALGLILIAAMPPSPAVAEDAAKPAATSAAKPESPATRPAKLGQTAKPEDLAHNPAKAALAAKPKAKPAAYLGTAECVRTGQRVIAALARDDSGAASQFHTFYTAFKCPPPQLALAFGCLVNLQKANPGLSNPTPEQVTQCWEEPSEIPKVQPQPAADGAGEKH